MADFPGFVRGRGRGGGKRGARGGRGGSGHRQEQEQPIRPTMILAKPDRGDSTFPRMGIRGAEDIDESTTAIDRTRVIFARKDNSVLSEADRTSSSASPLPSNAEEASSTGTATSPPATDAVPDKSHKLIDEVQQFAGEGLAKFLSGDNTDFLVVGVIGAQGVGKSSVLNALLGNQKSSIFRVQGTDKVAEHCTTGITAWVSPQRVIFLDCQPLNSFSVLERSIQTEKKYAEFGTSENTVMIQSLQMVGFLMSVCHVVLFVQDWFADVELVRLVQTAEMLRPTCFALSATNEGQMVEYFPSLVFVHNACQLEDFTATRIETMRDFYEACFCKSQLTIRSRLKLSATHDLREDHDSDYQECLNLFLLPDFSLEQAPLSDRPSFLSKMPFCKSVESLRRFVMSSEKKPLTTLAKQSERHWLQFCGKIWDNIKNSPLYMEYSRSI